MNEISLYIMISITVLSFVLPQSLPTINTGEDFRGNLELSKSFEGAENNAYLLEGEDEYTVGYGMKGHYINEDGEEVPVTSSTVLTDEEVEMTKQVRFEKEFLPELKEIPYWDEMSGDQQSVLASFAWNVGANFYGSPGFETISSALADKRWEDIPDTLMLYTKSGSESYREGLTKRRQAEAELWKRGLLSNQ